MTTDAEKHTDVVLESIDILSQLLKLLLTFFMSSTESEESRGHMCHRKDQESLDKGRG